MGKRKRRSNGRSTPHEQHGHLRHKRYRPDAQKQLGEKDINWSIKNKFDTPIAINPPVDSKLIDDHDRLQRQLARQHNNDPSPRHLMFSSKKSRFQDHVLNNAADVKRTALSSNRNNSQHFVFDDEGITHPKGSNITATTPMSSTNNTERSTSSDQSKRLKEKHTQTRPSDSTPSRKGGHHSIRRTPTTPHHRHLTAQAEKTIIEAGNRVRKQDLERHKQLHPSLEAQLLSKLRAIVPQHILTSAQERLRAQTTQKRSRTPSDQSNGTSPTTNAATLEAARDLILQLSVHKVLGGSNKTKTTSGSQLSTDVHDTPSASVMQNELARIVRERDTTIRILQLELSYHRQKQ